jgi:hypothetical protein
MNTVLTYATLNDAPKIKLTKSQIEALRRAKLWPQDRHGVAYYSIGGGPTNDFSLVNQRNFSIFGHL